MFPFAKDFKIITIDYFITIKNASHNKDKKPNTLNPKYRINDGPFAWERVGGLGR